MKVYPTLSIGPSITTMVLKMGIQENWSENVMTEEVRDKERFENATLLALKM